METISFIVLILLSLVGYSAIVEKFGEATGVPVFLNTSFNLRGKPIVNSPANAFNTFSKSGRDVLVLENFMIRK